MASYYDGGWPRYVPVAERRKKAAREMEKLRKKGYPVAPVTIEGRTIAKTFWGKAWCDNLESYRDYENRLPRGRTYARNGSVIDLQISALEIKAMVSGSSIYNVTITIKALAPTLWRSICDDCAGGIDSLVELLQGRFSKGVMERLCRQDKGLFPKPSEIRFSCSCLDGASMCKHVAAALYGVGARLDGMPELLFRLRAVDENDLVSELDEALPLSTQPLETGHVLETGDISALFGLDMEVTASAPAVDGAAPDAPKPAPRTGRRRPGKKAMGRKTAVMNGPMAADPKEETGIGQRSVVPKASPKEQISKARGSGKTRRHPPSDTLKPRKTSKKARGVGARKAAKLDMELTPDGFVKWWK
jgi:uncharacterized Zn finger protein